MPGPVDERLIIGVGYLGKRVARLWAPNASVYGTTRSLHRFEEIRSLGIQPVRYDVLAGGDDLPSFDTVLYDVGFDRSQGLSQREVYVEGLARTLARLPRPRLFIYVSSTGVYGNHEGNWVDEATPPSPVDLGGEACWEAEQTLWAFAKNHAWDVVVLRMAGIYGPGRWMGVERIQAGLPVAADPDGWLNLIHVEDAARVVESARQRARPGETYVVADGSPVRRRDFYSQLASNVAAPTPTFDPTLARRHRGDRRVRNEKMMQELRPDLQFPNPDAAWKHEHA